jgi:5-methyltetrahydrofolate--homocysteine methyltransferase
MEQFVAGVLDKIEEGVLLFDGVKGTVLMERGLSAGETCEALVLSHPDEVTAVHKAYFDAGADVVQTNTLGGTRLRLSHYGLSDKVAEINRRGAELARSVRPPGRFVAGEMGSTGKLLKPVGDADEAELRAAFAEQAWALAEGGVDLFIIETMMDVREALVALGAARETGLPAFVTVTFDKKPRGYFTIMGDRPTDAAKRLASAGAAAVGTNCTLRINEMIGVVAEMRAATNLPIIAQPNAGKPDVVGGRTVYPDGPEVYAAGTPELIRAGARIVGGCCGTTPETTRAMREVIDRGIDGRSAGAAARH